MSALNSLTQLLQESGAQFRIFDLGRQIHKISPADFAKIETGEKVYPSPYLHHAWLALTLWNPKQTEQSVVWFLKFPLDEQGYLVQAVRDDFINRLMLNINQMLDGTQISEAEDALKDNPFSFTPDQEKMAMFHAIMARSSKADKSQFYNQCQAYYGGAREWHNWQDLGLQGIAEVAVDIDNQQKSIIKHFIHYQQQPLIALCNALEHLSIGASLSELISQRLTHQLTLDDCDIALCCSLVRALYASPNQKLQHNALQSLLHSKIANSAEVLSTIAIKLSTLLLDPKACLLFLEKLAISEAGQQGFSRILSDLMFEANLRAVILQQFRNPQRSEALTIAIGQMFGEKF